MVHVGGWFSPLSRFFLRCFFLVLLFSSLLSVTLSADESGAGSYERIPVSVVYLASEPIKLVFCLIWLAPVVFGPQHGVSHVVKSPKRCSFCLERSGFFNGDVRGGGFFRPSRRGETDPSLSLKGCFGA